MLPVSKLLRRFSTAVLACKPFWGAGSRQGAAAPVSAALQQKQALVGGPAAAGGDEDELWMVVGLGNPGLQYDGTRHNIGFELVDVVAQQLGVKVTKIQDNAAVARGALEGKRLLLVKPMTFMNNSGEAVRKLCKYYKVPPSRVLVVYDDLDLPSGSVRLRAKGGHGGHNGMRSISAQLGGTQEFPRIRIGIGRPPGQMPVANYVLSEFSKGKEREDMQFAVQDAVRVLRSVLALGVERAASGVRV